MSSSAHSFKGILYVRVHIYMYRIKYNVEVYDTIAICRIREHHFRTPAATFGRKRAYCPSGLPSPFAGHGVIDRNPVIPRILVYEVREDLLINFAV